MAVGLTSYITLLCILKVVSSHPAGLWPEYIADDNTSSNLIDSTFEYPGTSGTTSTTDVSVDTVARGDDSDTADDVTSASTADDATSALTADDATSASTAGEVTTASTADTTLAGQDSSSTTIHGADSNNSSTWSATTDVTETTAKPQSSTLPPPTKQPPPENPKKSWEEIFYDKVNQFFSFIGHKLTDTANFIRRLFHWLY